MRNYTLQFDGTQNYVSLGTLGNLGSNLGSGFYWKGNIKTTQIIAGTLVGYLNAGIATAFAVVINSGAGGGTVVKRIRAFIRDNSGRLLDGGLSVDNNFNDGNSHTIEVYVDILNKIITIKIDDIQQTVTYAAQYALSGFSNFTHSVTLGCRNTAGTTSIFYDGILDDVEIGTSPANIYASYNMNEGVTRRNLIPDPSVEGTTFLGGQTQDTTNVLYGTKSARYYCTFSNGTRQAQQYLNAAQPITLTGGKTYLFSGHVYVPSDSPINKLAVTPRKWDWTGAQANLVNIVPGQWNRVFSIITVTSTSDWRLIIADPQAPSYTGTAYWYADGLMLEEYVGRVGENLITNPNFDTDTNNWTFDTTKYARDTTVTQSGNGSLKFSSATTVTVLAESAYIPVESNGLYSLSGYMQKKTGYTGAIVMYIIEYNAAYQQISVTSRTANLESFDVFVYMSIGYKLSENTKYVKVCLGNESNASGEAWFDNLWLEKMTIPPYFEGTTLPNGVWEGTPHQSISQLGLTDSTGNGNTGILKGNPLPEYVERPIIKNYNGIPEAQVKTRNGVPYAQIKSVNGYAG